MFGKEFNLDPMTVVAWTATLLAFTLTAQTASSADFEKGEAAFEREDYSVALSEFLPLAEQGHSDAQNYLGMMYFRGGGVPLDFALAAQWYGKAADQGNAQAQYNLGLMYGSGRGVPQDYVFAYAWTNLAAAQGHKKAPELRDKLRLIMTSSQIAEAQAVSRKFHSGTE